MVDVLVMENSIPEERFGEEIHVGIRPDQRLADCSKIIHISIYTHTQTQLFRISIFGEVLERFWIEILETKSCKDIVFYNVF